MNTRLFFTMVFLSTHLLLCQHTFANVSGNSNVDNTKASAKFQKYTDNRKLNRYFIVLDQGSVNYSYKSQNELNIIKRQRVDIQNTFIRQAARSNINMPVVARLTKNVNAIVAQLTPLQYAEIEKFPEVKQLIPSYDFQVALEDSVTQINADQVWDLNGLNSVLGEGVKVAVIDTGVDYTHPDLGGCLGNSCKVIGGYDFYNGDDDPMDDNFHGTHVAGIISANGALKGVAPKSSIVAYKVCDAQGNCPDYHIINAIEKAMDPDGNPATDDAVDIINISLGGSSGGPDDLIAQSINSAVDAGILVVVAGGNNGPQNFTMGSIASAEKALTVAAADGNTGIGDFSSRGYIKDNGHAKPEISAPGVMINSTTPNESYASFSGTSMASPMVAGSAALLLDLYSKLSPEELKSRLITTATDLGVSFKAQGSGVVDVLAAANADVSISASVINLGWFHQLTEMEQTKTITLSNDSEEERVYNLSISKTIDNTLGFYLSETQVTVAAGDSHQISLNINIPESLAAKSFDEPAYIAWLNIESNNNRSRLPIAILHTDDRITVNYPDFINHGKTVYLVDKERGLVGSQFPSSNNSSVTFFAGDGDYSIVFSAESVDLYNSVVQGVASGDTLEFSLNDEWLPVVFNLPDSENTRLDDEGSLGASLSATVYPVLPEYGVSFYTFILQYGDTTPQVYLKRPDINLFYDVIVSNSDENSNNNITLTKRLDASAIQANDTILFDYDYADLRELMIAFSPTGDLNNNFTTDWNYMDTNYPHDSGYGLGSFVPLEDLNQARTELHIPRPDDNFVHLYKAQQFSNTNSYPPDNSQYRTAQYHIDRDGNLALSNWYSHNPLLKTIDLIEKQFAYKAGFLLPFFKGKLIEDNGSFAMSYDEGRSPAFFADNMLTYYFGDVDAATDAVDTGISKTLPNNALRVDADSYFRPQNFAIDNSSSGSRFEFNSFEINGTQATLTAELEYDLTRSDFSPPTILELDISTLGSSHTFLANGNGEINVKFNDDIAVSASAIRIRVNDSDEWQEVASSDSNLVNAQLYGLAEGTYDLQVFAVDNAGNAITYSASPAFVAEAGCRYDRNCDGVWDHFDIDWDDDGVNNDEDAFPYDETEWLDTDGDGIGNNGDEDDDNDGTVDSEDAFPLDDTEWLDTDGDGIGNNGDEDDDNDGTVDSEDAFPLDDTEWLDTDGDGSGNNADEDDDNDGVNDARDAFPLNAAETTDTDNDGIGNNADSDDDGDGVPDTSDAYPLDASRSQSKSGSSSGGGGGAFSGIWLLALLLFNRKKGMGGLKINQ
ncbi:MAG: S8 family serine peptidase [Exilibacterium sp.]